MAFDALRLRNVIQLIGITRVYRSHCLRRMLIIIGVVFHLALMVAAALQVHQTKTALVTLPNCDGTDNYRVRLSIPNRSCRLSPCYRIVVGLVLSGRRLNLS